MNETKQEELDLYWPFVWPLQFYLFWWVVGFDMLFGTEKPVDRKNCAY